MASAAPRDRRDAKDRMTFACLAQPGSQLVQPKPQKIASSILGHAGGDAQGGRPGRGFRRDDLGQRRGQVIAQR